uniref:Uncharacterized protein n=1 Tax=Caenorhabditis tropicalis TaxID=1561998 RepID=A0A1I7U2S9_9PELO
MLRFKRGDTALDGMWTCIMRKQLNPMMDKGHYMSVPSGKLPIDSIVIFSRISKIQHPPPPTKSIKREADDQKTGRALR